jgi:hypothetical protein
MEEGREGRKEGRKESEGLLWRILFKFALRKSELCLC